MIRNQKHVARYTIEPIEVEITDNQGEAKLITISEITLCYQIDNFQFSSRREMENERAKNCQIRTAIPNFILEEEAKKTGTAEEVADIGEDLVIAVGDEVILKLASDNRKTKSNKHDKNPGEAEKKHEV
jgi:hypothetical protein